MRTQRVRGFTLVELLIVIAIIGTLVAMLLPAVQNAREASRRSACLNNIRQLALATIEYEIRFRRIPGLFETFGTQQPESKSSVPNTTWAVSLLADLERGRAYDANAAGQMIGTYVEVFLCPSDGDKRRSGPATSYVANGGRVDSVVHQKIQNGAFLNRIVDPDAKTLDGHWVDGREYTLLYSENLDATFYDEVGWNGYDEEIEEWRLDARFVFQEEDDRTWSPVFLWAAINDEGEDQLQTRINAPGLDRRRVECEFSGLPRRFTSKSCGARDGRILASWARPSSYHSGGVNVAYAGGRATFLRQDISYRVYIALMTLNDRKSDAPDPNFMLEDKYFQ